MAKTDNPDVQRFRILADDGQNEATVFLRPHTCSISVTKWPRGEDGIVNGVGVTQTIEVDRLALIGLAYEILHS